MDNIKISDSSLNTIKTLHKRGRGIICISAHYSNWELIALVIPHFGYLLNIIIRSLDNRLLNTFINRRRTAFNAKIMDRKNGYYQSCKALRNNEVIALLVDQNQAKGGIFIPFFGKLAATARGAASLARRTNASVMFTYVYRNSDNSHTLTFEEAKVIDYKSIKDFINLNTKKFSDYFEALIKEKPEQWLWFHDRWRTRP
jgi:KDO2-lipid IV(A) lauroyltransferase